jgi:hypothetical protein
MMDVTYQIEYRQKSFPDAGWKVSFHMRPKTRDEADRKAAACRQAMPLLEFRVREVRDADIPF